MTQISKTNIVWMLAWAALFGAVPQSSVAGAAGNHVYYVATKRIQQEVSAGISLTVAMTNTNVFPNMVIQMVSIGEESGSLDGMLSKVADFFEQEVDDAVRFADESPDPEPAELFTHVQSD